MMFIDKTVINTLNMQRIQYKVAIGTVAGVMSFSSLRVRMNV